MGSPNITFHERASKITDLSIIRIQQLLEIGQFTVIYVFFSMLLGFFLEKCFKQSDENIKASSTWSLIGTFVLRATVATVSAFYLHKIIDLFPFLFHLTSSYHPSLKGESRFGATIVLTFVLYQTQPSLIAIIQEIESRINGKK